MYTARNSGWLGPSGYIQAYPKISTKPGLRTRLAAWRRFFAYGLILLLAPFLAVYIVKLYASSLVVPISNLSGIQQPRPGYDQIGLRTPGSATLSITTSAPVEHAPDAALKQLLNDWAAKYPDQKWSVVVRGIEQDRRHAALNASDSYTIGTVEGLANHLERLYLGKNVSEERDRLLAKMNNDAGNRRGLMGCGQCRIFYESGKNGTTGYAQSIVDYPRGAYVLSVFTDGGSQNQIQHLAAEVHIFLSR